jgi:hypothetical protein
MNFRVFHFFKGVFQFWDMPSVSHGSLDKYNAEHTGGVLTQFFAPLVLAKNATVLPVQMICLIGLMLNLN